MRGGLFEECLRKSSDPNRFLPTTLSLAISAALPSIAIANLHLHNFTEAERIAQRGSKSNVQTRSIMVSCGELLQARGLLSSERANSASAEQLYQAEPVRSLDPMEIPILNPTSLLNLGAESLAQGRFDEAIDLSEAAHSSRYEGASRDHSTGHTQGNIGMGSLHAWATPSRALDRLSL